MVPAGGEAAPDSLLQFVITNNCIIKKGDDRTVTHTRMDGGKFHIPPEALAGFYAAYGAELYNERLLYYIEKNTPIFMMHFDIDFPSLMEEDRTEAFCETLHAAAAEYFQRPRSAVVCAILDATGARRGVGLHILFPDTWVDAAMACAVWAGVVARCEEKLPWGRDTWAKVVDVAVLAEKGSLRMVGSDKCKDCPSCHNGREEKKFCPCCNQKGTLPLGKIYWPWKIFPKTPSNQRTLDDLLLSKAHAARYCSIQSGRETPSKDFAIPAGAPRPATLSARSTICRMIRPGDNAMPKSGGTLSLSSEMLEALTQSIRDYDPHFGQLIIHDVAKATGKPCRCWIRVRGYHDRYCLNKGCEHASNQIYFVLSAKGLSQRCYSKKPELRRSGCFCKDFEGPPKPVPDEVMTTLLDVPQERRAVSPARGAKKRARTEGAELVCYGGFHHMSPDVMT